MNFIDKLKHFTVTYNNTNDQNFNDAISTIKFLREKYLALEAKQKLTEELNMKNWISVHVGLPDEHERVLITGIATIGCSLGIHIGELRNGWHFDDADNAGGCDPNLDKNVTHWMPLPASPQVY